MRFFIKYNAVLFGIFYFVTHLLIIYFRRNQIIAEDIYYSLFIALVVALVWQFVFYGITKKR